MDGNTTSVGYHPISFRDHRIGTLYVMAPHNLAENVEIFTNCCTASQQGVVLT
jgi:hypothetical protein